MNSIASFTALLAVILLLQFGGITAAIGDSSGVVHSKTKGTTDQCLLQVQKILTPEQIGNLTNMILKSGKGLNQLGLYEGCNELDNFEYVLLSVKQKANDFAVIKIGVWAPVYWNKEEYFTWMTDIMVQFVS